VRHLGFLSRVDWLFADLLCRSAIACGILYLRKKIENITNVAVQFKTCFIFTTPVVIILGSPVVSVPEMKRFACVINSNIPYDYF